MINGQPDDIDLKILDLLQRQGRMDVTRIARKVNKTPRPVHDRIHRLEEEGYIKGYIALLDRSRIGKPVLAVTMVKLEKQTTELLEQFELMAMDLPEIQSCLHVSGKWNFMLHVTAATPQDYYVILMEKLCNLPNVDHIESSFVLKECKSFAPFVL